MRHFLSVNQLTESDIFSLLRTAEYFQKNEVTMNLSLFAANLFFEPSTRTKMSFVVAEKKLGLEVLDFHAETSSVLKGESLYDTAKTFEAIGANILVIRHQDDYWYNSLANRIHIPIINAGAGKAEHPTQCMLDLFTIYQEFTSFKDLKVVISGDIKHSRVAKSNANALRALGAQVFFSGPMHMKDEELDFPFLPMDMAVEVCDVIMLLRVQHERHNQKEDTTNYLALYGLTKEREKRMQKHAIILHPAPVNRGVEMDSELVECSRSRIFKQMNNGVYIRMAIISQLLQERGVIHETAINQREKINL
jgi:aspartate carbamoyltransferase catalytic subunit